MTLINLQCSRFLLTFSKLNKFASFSPPILPQTRRGIRSICTKMATESSSHPTHTINLPSQLGQPVPIVAAPGVSDSEFRQVNSPFLSITIHYYEDELRSYSSSHTDTYSRFLWLILFFFFFIYIKIVISYANGVVLLTNAIALSPS